MRNVFSSSRNVDITHILLVFIILTFMHFYSSIYDFGILPESSTTSE